MRITSALTSVMLIALIGCGGKKAAKIDPNAAAAAASSWNGSLSTPAAMSGAVQIRGSAWMVADGNRTEAHVTVENATRGGEHPWHVHRGRCGYDNGIVGSPSSYPVLKISDKGTADVKASVDAPFPMHGEFFVNVHASADNMQTVVACANLAPPTQP